MDPKKLSNFKKGPEAIIQDAIIKALTLRGWYVMPTHGNMYQQGFPDLFCCHSKYGQRWVEVKNPKHYVFTPAQLECFPKICANGSAIWILISDAEGELDKLHGPFNWYRYLDKMY